MTTTPRVSGWANAALGFGAVALAVAAAVAIPHHLAGKPWWECDTPAEAQQALADSRAVAIGLVVASVAVGIVGAVLGLAGIQHNLISRLVNPGRIVGQGRAFAGLLLSGNAAAAFAYAAVKQQGRADPVVFLAMPAMLSALVAWQAYRWWRRTGAAALAAVAPADPDSNPPDTR